VFHALDVHQERWITRLLLCRFLLLKESKGGHVCLALTPEAIVHLALIAKMDGNIPITLTA